VEDRRQPPPSSPLGYIARLPAQILLDRLPVPIVAIHDGAVVYANRAFKEMLGCPADSLSGAAADLIHADTSAEMPAAVVLQEQAGQLVGLCHADGSIVKVIVSKPLLVRADDPVLLIGVQDVTQHLWEKGC